MLKIVSVDRQGYVRIHRVCANGTTCLFYWDYYIAHMPRPSLCDMEKSAYFSVDLIISHQVAPETVLDARSRREGERIHQV